LTTVENAVIEKAIGQLLNRFISALVTSIHNVDAVRVVIRYLLFNEAAEAGQVGRNRGDATDGTLNGNN
jgi:hypothetical protein